MDRPEETPRPKRERRPAVPESEWPQAIVELVGDDPNGVTTEKICRRLGHSPQDLGDTFEELAKAGKIRGFAGLWIAPEAYAEGCRRFLAALADCHAKTPNQTGIPRERVAHVAGLTWAGKTLDRVVADLAVQKLISANGTQIRDLTFQPQLATRQREFLDRVIEVLEREPVNVSTPPEIARIVVAPAQAVSEILVVGVKAGELVKLADQMFYTPRQLEAMKTKLAEAVGMRPFSVGEARDGLGSSRKYIIPILEHFDAVGFTEWRDEQRVIRR